ncbi:LHFPL tetraspan subfamily member 2a protein-like [Thrips palmi]|uniref:LHFPL tetraspan subfamily member 2a protein-like n=1 Tax=Thrips palmi TaxID=161013 RepID=A0A6P8YXR6_THRPL|nr:LHFPL tetraspan subfamily member 2a protein-like [Thrips palmi]
MGHVIVTARSLAWLLLSLVALMAVLGALVSPRWIVAPPVAAVAGLLACCVHAVCGKSILGVCGAAQAGAGVLYLLGLSLYAGGWGAERVQRLCGPDASPFYLDSCSLGWASYSAVAGALLTLVVAVLSAPADRAARSDKVQERIYRGHTLVCIA